MNRLERLNCLLPPTVAESRQRARLVLHEQDEEHLCSTSLATVCSTLRFVVASDLDLSLC